MPLRTRPLLYVLAVRGCGANSPRSRRGPGVRGNNEQWPWLLRSDELCEKEDAGKRCVPLVASDRLGVPATVVAASGDFRCGRRAGKEGIGSLRSCRGRWYASRSSSASSTSCRRPRRSGREVRAAGFRQLLRGAWSGCRGAQVDGTSSARSVVAGAGRGVGRGLVPGGPLHDIAGEGRCGLNSWQARRVRDGTFYWPPAGDLDLAPYGDFLMATTPVYDGLSRRALCVPRIPCWPGRPGRGRYAAGSTPNGPARVPRVRQDRRYSAQRPCRSGPVRVPGRVGGGRARDPGQETSAAGRPAAPGWPEGKTGTS
jgi:hypothetical protein